MNQIVFSAQPPTHWVQAKDCCPSFKPSQVTTLAFCLTIGSIFFLLLLHSQNNPDFNSPWSKRKHTITQISTKASKHGPHCYFGSNWDIGLWSFLVHFSSVLPTKVPQRRSKVVTRKVQNLEVHFQALNEEFGPFWGHFSAFFATGACFEWPYFSVFYSFEKCQIRFPLKNHEIAMGTCFDVLFLTTECNENLFFKELHKMSK